MYRISKKPIKLTAIILAGKVDAKPIRSDAKTAIRTRPTNKCAETVAAQAGVIDFGSFRFLLANCHAQITKGNITNDHNVSAGSTPETIKYISTAELSSPVSR